VSIRAFGGSGGTLGGGPVTSVSSSRAGLVAARSSFGAGVVPPIAPVSATVPVSVGPAFAPYGALDFGGVTLGTGGGAAVGGLGRTGSLFAMIEPGTGVGTASRIASSSFRRSAEPGGGGGWVLRFARGVGAGSGSGVSSGIGVGSGFVEVGSGSSPTDQPDARSAIRLFVASPRRRRVRSSSGTDAR